MTAAPRTRRRAFTLIELMVVVTIIAILAALIVPALQKAQAKAMAMNCLSRAKSIATSVRTYASSWDGWTNPDPQYYVKLMGFRIDIPSSAGTGQETIGYLNNDAPGWASDSTTQSYRHAQSLGDLMCPVDESPRTTKHAIRSSYAVTSFFAGDNIMNNQMPSNEILAVSEVGKRHPRSGGAGGDVNDGHYVYADLHATLGYTGPALAGSKLRVWHQSSDAGIRNIAESALPEPLFEEIYASDWHLPMDWSWGRLEGLLGSAANNDWYPIPRGGASNGRNQYPLNFCVRLDGILHLPVTGTWEFCVWGSDRSGYFGIGDAQDSPMATSDSTKFTWAYRQNWWNPNWGQTPTVIVQPIDQDKWYPIQMMHWGADYAGDVAVSIRRQDGSGGYDANFGGATGVVLSSQYIYRNP